MVLIPAGEFLMGSNEGNFDETPAHRVYLSAYYIDKHEVTNAEFAAFIRESESFDTFEGPWFRYYVEGCIDLITHYEKRYGTPLLKFNPGEIESEEEPDRIMNDFPRWRSAFAALQAMMKTDQVLLEGVRINTIGSRPEVQKLIKRQARLPVRGVAWRDAAAYARFVGKRLPTEAEWEKAARGTDGRVYPWGNSWDPKRCRIDLEYEAGPAPVGSYPDGASPYGCFDMAGNVWEWVADWYGEYYYSSSQSELDPKGPIGLPNGELPAASDDIVLLRTIHQGRASNTRKVLRGGAWRNPKYQDRFNARCARRLWNNPNYWHLDVGFRCAMDVD